MLHILHDIITQTWLITAQMAPYLLLGFTVAGILSVCISPAWMERHLGGRGPGPIFKAALFGIPLPLCSCGVLPVAASLRRHGASRGATTAFLLSTPQTGVDSVLVTWTMLGPFFALFRPVVALVTGLVGGIAVGALDPDEHRMEATQAAENPRSVGLFAKLRSALSYGLVTLPGDIGRALVVGLVLAGILGAVVPPAALNAYLGHGPLAILVMMLVGIPLYVCATGSVPIAATFIYLGASPGAALAFLVAGPATNAAALATVTRILGRRAAVAYLGCVAASAFGFGLALDWLLPKAALKVPFLDVPAHVQDHVNFVGHLGALVLLLVLAWSWRQRSHQESCGDGACGDGACMDGEPQEETCELAITGMHCSHCSGSVTRSLSELPEVASCEVFLEEGRAVVTGHGLDPRQMIQVITELGYSATLAAGQNQPDSPQ